MRAQRTNLGCSNRSRPNATRITAGFKLSERIIPVGTPTNGVERADMTVEELLGLVGASDMHGFVLQDGMGDRLCAVRILISRADQGTHSSACENDARSPEAGMTPVQVGNWVFHDVLEVNPASGTGEAAGSANDRVLAAPSNL